MRIFISLIIVSYLTGCAVPVARRDVSQPNYYAEPAYQERETIKASLFENDSANISNEAADTILNGKLEIPLNARAALLKLRSSSLGVRYYGYNYWRSEGYFDLQQQYVDVLTKNLLSAKQVNNVVALPSFIASEKLNLSQMREAAVRMQAHLLVIYNIHSDIFQEYRLFSKDQVKAFSTCEAAVLDTKTGIFPFTDVVTKKLLIERSDKDTDISETRKRAEVDASTQCLETLGTSISTFFNEL